MTSQDIERRMKRTENDITAVYEMLGDLRSVQGQHSAALIRIEARLAGHDGRFDAIDGRFEQLTATVSEILRRLPEAG
ncbi:MAG TPA: hypothetical protein VFA96_09250 [Nocardioides sp.]|nr:hypothetical protein [Nocardioides sp.]